MNSLLSGFSYIEFREHNSMHAFLKERKQARQNKNESIICLN